MPRQAGNIIINSLITNKLLPPTEFADLILSIVWILGGVALWKRKALGYFAGAALLFQATILFVGLLISFVLQPFVANVTFPLVDFIVIFIMGWVCYIPFGLFIRNMRKDNSDSSSI